MASLRFLSDIRKNLREDRRPRSVNARFCRALLPLDKGCDESLATNALKHLMDQLEERILQTGQLKNASKHL